jgi:hypothetical protein
MTAEPEPSPRRWGLGETAAAVGVAAVIAAFGGAAIYAATEGSSHSFGAPHQAVRPGGGVPGGPGGPGGQHGAIGGPAPAAVGSTSLHGEFVVPDGSGGYSQTYVIPNTAGNAGPPFAVDDHIVLRATRKGQTATVTNIGNPQQDGSSGLGAPPHRN